MFATALTICLQNNQEGQVILDYGHIVETLQLTNYPLQNALIIPVQIQV